MIPRVEPRPDRLKRCSKCKDWFPINCFPRDRQHPDGHRNECKSCRSQNRKDNRNIGRGISQACRAARHPGKISSNSEALAKAGHRVANS